MRVIATLLAAALALAAADSDSVTFIDHDKMAAAFAKGGRLVMGSDFQVSGSHRDAPGGAEVHEKGTDVLYLVEGEATLVTGGTIVNAKPIAPGEIRGTEIHDGREQHLVKGDLVVIPAGVPHWFKDVTKSTSYLTVKVLKP
jgi:mannose-6-phosphate isomerase-like protein (cupin superfamily)